jgi:hypothetical protein
MGRIRVGINNGVFTNRDLGNAIKQELNRQKVEHSKIQDERGNSGVGSFDSGTVVHASGIRCKSFRR